MILLLGSADALKDVTGQILPITGTTRMASV
jgi:hypothetical protein